MKCNRQTTLFEADDTKREFCHLLFWEILKCQTLLLQPPYQGLLVM